MAQSPEIAAAWISGLCGVAAAVIAAIAASLIGSRIMKQNKLKADLDDAKKDIEFLLAVESAHCQIHKEVSGKSFKNTVRDEIRKPGALTWSAKFTPGRVRGDGGDE